MIKEGVKAIKYFSQKGIKTNCTLVFSAGQALLAAKAGATYVSPFIGRLDDISTDGLGLIEDIRLIYDNYGYDTEILAASEIGRASCRERMVGGAEAGRLVGRWSTG